MENRKDSAQSPQTHSDFLSSDKSEKNFGPWADLAVPCPRLFQQPATTTTRSLHTADPQSADDEQRRQQQQQQQQQNAQTSQQPAKPKYMRKEEHVEEEEEEEEDAGKEEEEEEEGVGEGGGEGGGGGWREERMGEVVLFGVPIVSLHVEGLERLCLAQISSSLLHEFSYNEIHNRRVALGITCLQCTPAQLEVLRRAGAMPVTSRRCGLITKREAERLVRSFIADVPPPRLPDNFFFRVRHRCGWGNEGVFVPARYNSSRAKCIKCSVCEVYFSPNKFIFHCHPTPTATYRHPNAANFNSWRRHLELVHDGSDERMTYAWEDVKAMFNGGSRKRTSICSPFSSRASSFPSSARANLSFENFPFRNKCSDEVDLRPQTHGQNLQGTRNSSSSSRSNSHNHHSNNGGGEMRGWGKFQPHKSVGPPPPPPPPPPQPPMPFPASSLSLMPPSLGGGAHPAFFGAGLQSHGPMPVSYGEFLRSMSRPYNVRNLSLAGSNLLPDMYRASPAKNLAPGLFGSSPYPLNYLRYPAYLPSASISQAKGGNSTFLPCQLSEFKGLKTENNSESVRNEGTCDIVGIPEHLKTTEDTQDEIIVDEEEDKEKRCEDKTSPRITEDNEDKRHGGDTLKLTSGTEKGSSCSTEVEDKVLDIDNDNDNEKIDDRRRKEQTQIPTEEQGDANDAGNLDNRPSDQETKVQEPVKDASSIQEHKLKASSLPSDTKSLLNIFEETEDVDTFIHLPIETLRVLYKASKKKSRATDRELKKLKEMQRVQRVRAEELRDQLSRQFFALKETIWAEIEKERKMRTTLQDRLAETQKLTASQNYRVFPNLK